MQRASVEARLATVLVLLALPIGVLLAAPTHPILHGAKQGGYDDTTTGAIAHPELAFAVGSAPLQRAQQLAKAHWGSDPCGGQVEIVWSPLAATISALSTWTNPGPPFDNPALNSGCKVTFNPAAKFDWSKLCTVTIHEYGHLAGKRHSRNPGEVMYRYYNKPAPECVEPKSPYRLRHGRKRRPGHRGGRLRGDIECARLSRRRGCQVASSRVARSPAPDR